MPMQGGMMPMGQMGQMGVMPMAPMGMMSPMGMGMGMMGPMAMPMMGMMPMGPMGMMGMMPMMGMGGMMPGMGMPSGPTGPMQPGGQKEQEQAYESAMAVIRAGPAAGSSEREAAEEMSASRDAWGAPVPRSNPLNPAYRPPDSEPMPGVTDRRFEGKIRLFIEDQGYGFIKTDGLSEKFPDKASQVLAQDVFLHRNQKGRFVQGDTVSFTVFINFRGKPQATDLRKPRQDDRELHD